MFKKNPPTATRQEEARVREHAGKHSRVPSAQTLELCGYTLIFTTLPEETYSNDLVVEVYRLRWQIELIFKRLKSLLEQGQLHQYDDLSIRTYLNGKILIALLIEKMIRMAETFSP